MTVESFDNFISGQLDNLKEYITPYEGLHWPQIAIAAREARDVISSFVVSELQRQVATHNTNLNRNNLQDITVKEISLARDSNSPSYDRPFSRCSLRTVRTSLYKLARVIKPLRMHLTRNTTGIIGTHHQDSIHTFAEIPFNNLPFRRDPEHGHNPATYFDQWYASLSFWLFSFVTGLCFTNSANANSGTSAIFTPDLQAAALTNTKSDFFVINTSQQGTSWSQIVDNTTVLMTLSQSLDALLELPELRAGILCANYMKMIESLLPDVIDYNIDLKNESNSSVTHYVRGRMRIIAEFAKQELGSLNNLRERQVPCLNLPSELRIYAPGTVITSTYHVDRTYNVPSGLSSAIAVIP